MFIKKISKILPYLAVVPADPDPLLIGIKYFNLNTFMGQTLGWLKWPNLFGLLFSAIVFAIAAFYIIRYTRGYFGRRKISKSWRFIIWGLFITVIAETGELFCFYEWPMSGLIEQNLLLVIPHALGGALIGFGAYFLYKEIT